MKKLADRLRTLEQEKEETIMLVGKLHQRKKARALSAKQHKSLIAKVCEGKTEEEHLRELNWEIEHVKKQLSHKKTKHHFSHKHQLSVFFGFILFFALVGIVLYNQPVYTGLVGFDQAHTEDIVVGMRLTENSSLSFNQTNITSIRITGTAQGDGRVRVYTILDGGELDIYTYAGEQHRNQITGFAVLENETTETNDTNTTEEIGEEEPLEESVDEELEEELNEVIEGIDTSLENEPMPEPENTTVETPENVTGEINTTNETIEPEVNISFNDTNSTITVSVNITENVTNSTELVNLTLNETEQNNSHQSNQSHPYNQTDETYSNQTNTTVIEIPSGEGSQEDISPEESVIVPEEPVVFEDAFTRYCLETCDLLIDAPELFIEIENAVLDLELVHFSTLYENQPPEQIQEFPDIIVYTTGTTIDLNSYFTDPDGDTIIYDVNEVSGLTRTITHNILEIQGEPGTYNVYVYALDSDTIITGNTFTVTIVEPIFENTTIANTSNQTENISLPVEELRVLKYKEVIIPDFLKKELLEQKQILKNVQIVSSFERQFIPEQIIGNRTALNLTNESNLTLQKWDIVVVSEDNSSTISLEGIQDVDAIQHMELFDASLIQDTTFSFTGKAFGIEGVTLDNAILTLPKQGIIQGIARCDTFDYDTYVCLDGWYDLPLSFEDQGETIRFSVDRFSATAYYNYSGITNPSSSHIAWEGSINSSLPAYITELGRNLETSAEFTNTDYRNVENMSDGLVVTHEITAGPGIGEYDFPSHLFRFNISEPSNKVDALTVEWNGSGGQDDGVSDYDTRVNISIWNDSGTAWYYLSSCENNNNANWVYCHLIGSVIDTPADFIDENDTIYIRASAGYGMTGIGRRGAGKSIISDFVQLEVNYTLGLSVSLNYPLASSLYTNNSIEFNFTPVTGGEDMANCSLWTDESGWGLRTSNTSALTLDAVNTLLHNLSVGTYVWNIQCTNSTAHSVFATANSSVTLVPFEVTLEKPPDDSIIETSNNTLGFNYSITAGVSTIDNCSLWTNEGATWEARTQNNSAVSTSQVNSINYTFGTEGTYDWNVYCFATDGSIVDGTQNFTVTAVITGENTCTPPQNAVWYISNATTCTNTVINVSNISISTGTGNLTLINTTILSDKIVRVNTGANLTLHDNSTLWASNNVIVAGSFILDNSSLRMNGSADGRGNFSSSGAGVVLFENNSFVSNGKTLSANYNVDIQDKLFRMLNTELSYAGWSTTSGRRGLELDATVTDANISYSKFSHNYIPLYLNGNSYLFQDNVFFNSSEASIYLMGQDILLSQSGFNNTRISIQGTDNNITHSILNNSVVSITGANTKLENITYFSYASAITVSSNNNVFNQITVVGTNDISPPLAITLPDFGTNNNFILENSTFNTTGGIQIADGDNHVLRNITFNTVFGISDAPAVDIRNGGSGGTILNNIRCENVSYTCIYSLYQRPITFSNIHVNNSPSANAIMILSAHNVVDNLTADNVSVGIYKTATTSNSYVKNSRIYNTLHADIELVLNSLNIINVTYNRSSVDVDSATGVLREQWWVDTYVNDSITGAALDGAAVNITNRTGSNVRTSTTNSTGYLTRYNITALTFSASGNDTEDNHAFNASRVAYLANGVSKNISLTNNTFVFIELPVNQPVAPGSSLSLTPESGYIGDMLVCANVSSYDSNQDNFTSTFNWYKDDEPFYRVLLPFEINRTGLTDKNLTDYSGNNFQGWIGDEDSTGYQPVWTTEINNGSGYIFTRSSNHTITIPDNASLRSFVNTSWFGWFTYEECGSGITDFCTLFAKGDTEEGVSFFYFGWDDTIHLRINGTSDSTIAPTLTPGTLHSFGLSCSDTDCVYYLDGTYLGSSGMVPNQTTFPITVGAQYPHQSSWNGTIYDFRIVNQSVTAKQMLEWNRTKLLYDNTKDIIHPNSRNMAEQWTCEVFVTDQWNKSNGVNASVNTTCGATATWNVTQNITCTNTTIELNNTLAISAGSNLTFKNMNVIPNYIGSITASSSNAYLYITDLDNDPDTTGDRSHIHPSASNYISITGSGFDIRNSILDDTNLFPNGDSNIQNNQFRGINFPGTYTAISVLNSNNVITGNTIDNKATGISVANSVSNTFIENNTVDNSANYDLIYYAPTSFTNTVYLRRNTLTSSTTINTTIYQYNSSPILTYSSLYGGGDVFYYTNTTNISVSEVYWGTIDEAIIQEGIYDYYDNSGLGVVNYCAYLTNVWPAKITNKTELSSQICQSGCTTDTSSIACCNPYAGEYAPRHIENEIVSLFFEEGIGNLTFDSAQNVGGGDIRGNIQWTTDGLRGSALYFNKSNTNYVNFSSSEIVQAMGEPFSVSVWIKDVDVSAGYYGTAISTENLEEGKGFSLGVRNFSGIVTLAHFVNGGVIVSNISVDPSVWTHIVGVYNGTHNLLYVNGTNINTAIVNNPGEETIHSALPLTLGRMPIDYSGFWYPFGGTLDNVRIYDEALDADQIRDMYFGVANTTTLVSMHFDRPGITHNIPEELTRIDNARFQHTIYLNNADNQYGVDAYVQNNSATNFGSGTTLLLEDARAIYVKFNVSSIPSGVNLLNASFGFSGWVTNNRENITMFQVWKPWEELEINGDVWSTGNDWATDFGESASDTGVENTGDGIGYDRAASSLIGLKNISSGSNQFYNANITRLVQSWINGTYSWNRGITLRSSDPNWWTGYSREQTGGAPSTNRPRLFMDFVVNESFVTDQGRAFVTGFTTENGYMGRGIYLNATNNFPINASGMINASLGTISLWVKPNWDGTDSGVNYIFQHGDDSPANPNSLSILRINDLLYFNRSANIAYTASTTNISSWNAGEWHHVVVTFNRTGTTRMNGSIYIDGVLKNNTRHYADVSLTGTPAYFYLGTDDNLENEGNITLDEFRIFNELYNATQVFELLHVPATTSVINYSCYSGGQCYQDLLSIPNGWVDRDDNSSYCEYSSDSCTEYTWTTSGESADLPHGEYTDGVTPSCCGDDSNEITTYFACTNKCTTDTADTTCCSLATDCVYSGTCYATDNNYVIGSDVLYCDDGYWRGNVPSLINVSDNTSVQNKPYVVANNSVVEFRVFYNHNNSNDTATSTMHLLIANNTVFTDCNTTDQSGCLASATESVEYQDINASTVLNDTAWGTHVRYYAKVCTEDEFCSSIADVSLQDIYNFTQSSLGHNGLEGYFYAVTGDAIPDANLHEIGLNISSISGEELTNISQKDNARFERHALAVINQPTTRSWPAIDLKINVSNTRGAPASINDLILDYEGYSTDVWTGTDWNTIRVQIVNQSSNNTLLSTNFNDDCAGAGCLNTDKVIMGEVYLEDGTNTPVDIFNESNFVRFVVMEDDRFYSAGAVTHYIFSYGDNTYNFIRDVGTPTILLGHYTENGTKAYVPSYPFDYIFIEDYELQDTNGVYEIRLAEELYEVSYIDAQDLWIIDSPADYVVLPDYSRTGELYSVKKEHISPDICKTNTGQTCLEKISHKDDLAWKEQDNNDAIQLHFPPVLANQYKLIIRDAFQYSQHPYGEKFPYPPKIYLQQGLDDWVEITAPQYAGKTQSYNIQNPYFRDAVIDITQYVVPGEPLFIKYEGQQSSRYSVVDYIGLDTSDSVDYKIMKEKPLRAILSPHTNDSLEIPFYYNKLTKYGDVLPLVKELDDELAIMSLGDKITLYYPSIETKKGWNRQYVLASTSYYKPLAYDPDVLPLPSLKMGNYLEQPKETPDWYTKYNTRASQTNIPPPIGSPENSVNSLYTDYVGVIVNHSHGGIVIDTYAPTCVLESFNESTSYSYATGSVFYYNDNLPAGYGTSSNYTLVVDGLDYGIGYDYATFPSLTSTGATNSSRQPSRYYTWDSLDTQNYFANVSVYDLLGNMGYCEINVTRDASAPSGGYIQYADVTSSTNLIFITYSEGADTGSGINTTNTIYKREAPYSPEGTCGSWSDWESNNTIAISDSSPEIMYLEYNKCYQFKFAVHDFVNNTVEYTNNSIYITDPCSPATNWAVADSYVCENKTINLNGNITITSGNLTLRNVTVLFNAISNGSNYFIMGSYGILNTENDVVFTTNESRWYWQARTSTSTSSLYLRDTLFERMGYGPGTNERGLYASSETKQVFSDFMIRDTYGGLLPRSATSSTMHRNITIQNASYHAVYVNQQDQKYFDTFQVIDFGTYGLFFNDSLHDRVLNGNISGLGTAIYGVDTVNLTVYNTTIYNASIGIHFSNATNILFDTSQIKEVQNNSFLLNSTVGNINITVLDSNYTKGNISFENCDTATCELHRKWTVQVSVNTSNEALQGANVTFYSTGNYLENWSTTLGTGYIIPYELTAYYRNATALTSFNNYTINVSYPPYPVQTLNVNVSSPQTFNVTLNNYPTIDAPLLTPSSPSISQDIMCNTTAYDADLDPINVTFEWYQYNGTDWTLNFTNVTVTTNGTTVNYTLDAANTSEGDEWNCTVYATDPYSNSSVKKSINISPSTCGTITSDITLSASATATGTCFTAGADNIVIDCAGNTITYATSSAGYGYAANGYDNTTLKNCVITQGSHTGTTNYGVNLASSSNNNTIINNTVTTSTAQTISVLSSSYYNQIQNNTIYINHATADGVYVVASYNTFSGNIINSRDDGFNIGSANVTLLNNKITTNSSTGVGIRFDSADYYLEENFINASATDCLYGQELQSITAINNTLYCGRYGYYGYESGNTTFNRNNITSTSFSIYLIPYFNYGANNTFTDGRYTNSFRSAGSSDDFLINTTTSAVTVSGNANVTTQWYIRFNVTDSDGVPIENATVFLNDTNDINFMIENTSSVGLTSYVLVNDTMYRETPGNIEYNNHTIFVYHPDYAVHVESYDITASQIYHITLYNNVAPDIPVVTLNSTSNTNYTFENLTCSAELLDFNQDDLNVSLQWYKNGVLDLSYDYNNSYANGTLFTANLSFENTTKGDVWNCSIRTHDGEYYSGWGNSTELTIRNSQPTQVTLITPSNGNTTLHDRRPLFNWTEATDADGDAISYIVRLDLTVGICPDQNWNITNISTSNFTLNNSYEELHIMTDCGGSSHVYNWSVVANDGEENGTWSTSWNFSIEPYVDLNLTNALIDFGSLVLGQTASTVSDTPTPFIIENIGNVQSDLVNVSANESLWDTVALGTHYFQMKARNSTSEPGSFNETGSSMSWFNITNTNSSIVHYLNYSDLSDEVYVDVGIEVPGAEPPGTKSTFLIFTWEQSP